MTEVLKMEIVTHSVHLFKARTLLEQVVKPFCDVAEDNEIHESMFIAGFGNTLMDVQAYHMAGLKLHQIYAIDTKSRISCFDFGIEPDEERQQRQQEEGRESRDPAGRTDIIANFEDDALPADKNESLVLKVPLARRMYKNR